MLASSIIDTIDPRRASIFYYCDYADKRTLEPANVFGTLARQVLENVEIIPEALASDIEYADHDGDRLTDQKAALDFFCRSVKLSPRSFSLVFDGLDEASEKSQKAICNSFRELLHDSTRSIKLLVTGREDFGFLLRLEQAIPFFKVPISAAAIARDIGSYVGSSTRRRIVEGSLVIQDPKLEALIVEELVKGAKGMSVTPFCLFWFATIATKHSNRRSGFFGSNSNCEICAKLSRTMA